MKNQVKVEKTEIYKDSQKGDTIVCRGKLVLKPSKEKSVLYGVQNKVENGKWLYFFTTNETSDVVKGDYKWIQPIIISETEDIDDGDDMLQAESIIVNVRRPYVIMDYDKKILAFPENFSPKQLTAIVDGKLKDGDVVLVECQEKDFSDITHYDVINIVKLNKDNHITLMPAKKEFTKAEQEAIRRFQNGEKWSCSSFIDEDTIVAGYGQLDHKSNPYDFEFPLPTVYIKAIYGSTSWNMATKKEKEIDQLNEQVAELLSLKRSIIESRLKEFFPKREMSFHDKVVLAIDAAITYNIDSIRGFGKYVGYSNIMTEEYIKSMSKESYVPPTRK